MQIEDPVTKAYLKWLEDGTDYLIVLKRESEKAKSSIRFGLEERIKLRKEKC